MGRLEQTHVARHGVTPEEVEQVCHGSHITRLGDKGRLVIIGVTQAGRTLFVVLDPELESEVYYPVTARTADRKERQLYREEKGGEDASDQAA